MGPRAGVDDFGEKKMILSLPGIFIAKFFFCSLFVLLPHLFHFLDRPALLLCPYCTTHTTKTSLPAAVFKPATPVSDRLQTLALDRSATGTGQIRTRNFSKRAATSPHPMSLDHWDR